MGYLGQYECERALAQGDAGQHSLRNESDQRAGLRMPPAWMASCWKTSPPTASTYTMVAEGDELNKSGLRIDLLADEAQLATASPAALVKGLQEWVAAQLAQTMENRTAE